MRPKLSGNRYVGVMLCAASAMGSPRVWPPGGPLFERRPVRLGANVSVGLWLRHGDEWAPRCVVVHLIHFPIAPASALLQL